MRSVVLALSFLLFAVQPSYACTVLSLADDSAVVFAGNEDGTNTDARIWIVEASDETFGGIYFGFADGFRQAGMNTGGLCYDIAACPRMALTVDESKAEPETNLIQDAMDRCATVDEVLELLGGYNLEGFERVQVVFADRHGAAAVIDANHILRDDDGRLAVTNYYLSAPELGRHPCGRHDIADSMMPDGAPTVDDARRILSAVRQEGRSQTQYSHICEPRDGRVTFFRFHDYECPVVFDLDAELAKGAREVVMADLFPRNFAAEDWTARQERKLSTVFLRTLDESGLDAAVAEYRETKVDHSEILNELANLGFVLQGEGRLEEAAAAFGLMTEDFPTFARGFEWYGNVLTRREKYPEAAAAYRDCLAVDPENSNARDVLQQIEAALAPEE